MFNVQEMVAYRQDLTDKTLMARDTGKKLVQFNITYETFGWLQQLFAEHGKPMEKSQIGMAAIIALKRMPTKERRKLVEDVVMRDAADKPLRDLLDEPAANPVPLNRMTELNGPEPKTAKARRRR